MNADDQSQRDLRQPVSTAARARDGASPRDETCSDEPRCDEPRSAPLSGETGGSGQFVTSPPNAGVTVHEAVRERLRHAGLRPTRQRLELHHLLFGTGDRHFTAEMIHGEAVASGMQVSLATIYNTLHQFRAAGLLRQIAVEAGRTYFDTNPTDHAHYFNLETGDLEDGPNPFTGSGMVVPEGMEVESVDVIVRLRKARGDGQPAGDRDPD